MHEYTDTFDPILGAEIQDVMWKSGFELPLQKQGVGQDFGDAEAHLSVGISGALEALGLDMKDPSLKDTPRRYAKMFVQELTRGLDYNRFPACTATPNGVLLLQGTATGRIAAWGTGSSQSAPPQYHGAYNQMVLVKDIQVMSLCEHHLQTIDGVAHIAYIPRNKLLGLSKFARVTDFFARRPQVQERLTQQIFVALEHILDTSDIGVVLSCTHYCMKARGSMQHQSKTVTDMMGGRFMTKPELRQEFLQACH